MKTLVVLLALFVGQAFAVPGVANSTGAWRNVGTTPSWSGGSGGSVGGVASTIETVRVGSTYIPVPVTGTISGTAVAQTMVSALKSTPQAMLGGMLLSWLMNQGMEWIDGQWKKKTPATTAPPTGGSCAWKTGGYCGDTPQQAADNFWQHSYSGSAPCTQTSTAPYGNYYSVKFHCVWASVSSDPTVYPVTASCPAGSTYDSNQSTCIVPEGYRPAGDSDWDQVAGVTPPDAVMNDICGRLFALDGVGCRVTGLGTKTAVAPLSDSYTDGTGTNWQQTGKWTPAPTADNPLAGDIQIVKTALTQQGTKTNSDGSTTTTTVDPNTGKITETTTYPDNSTKTTVTDPTTDSKTTTSTDASGNKETKTETPDKDFCVQHPKASACQELGEADDSVLEKQNAGSSITPVTVGGAGACPSDKHVSYIGKDLVISYQPICMAANWINPVVLAIAWLIAGTILIGAVRGGD
jgi:hypothetical protein